MDVNSQTYFEGFVPRAGHQIRLVVRFHPVARFDGRIVLGDLKNLIGTEIPAFDLFVARRNKHFGAVLMDVYGIQLEVVTMRWNGFRGSNYIRPANVQYWAAHRFHLLRNGFARLFHFPASNL